MATNIEKINTKDLRTADTLNQVARILQEIRFGSVEIIIHEGRVVQIERKEKMRFENK